MTTLDPHQWWTIFPPINATLNGVSAILLGTAFVMIKQKRVSAHRNLMISAFATSTIFLACYLTFHTLNWLHGIKLTPFPQSPWRPWYLLILLTHSVLAVVILPLIFLSFYFAFRAMWSRHHKIASITFPLWFYVSVTGVVVYLMLYQLAPTL